MKEKIVYLILEILIGAIITAGGFMVFSKKGGRPNEDMPKGGMENRIRGNRQEDMPELPEGMLEDMENRKEENV